MKKTLLDMVQSILSSMDSDEVNSFADTTESQQVANCLRDSYFEIMAGANPPDNNTLFQLNASGDPTKPTLMSMPANINSLMWIKYNLATTDNPAPNFQDIQFLPLHEFSMLMYQLGSNTNLPSPPDVGTFNIADPNGGQVPMFYRNDRGPMFYTCGNDTTLLFDSYDSVVDTTLQSIKTVCFGEYSRTWTFTDAFVPSLPDHLFPLLENEAKKQAFIEFKQSANPLAEERAHKGWVRQRRIKQGVPYGDAARVRTHTNFGRHGTMQTGPLRTYNNTVGE